MDIKEIHEIVAEIRMREDFLLKGVAYGNNNGNTISITNRSAGSMYDIHMLTLDKAEIDMLLESNKKKLDALRIKLGPVLD